MQAVIVPGMGMDKYLEEISALTMPDDAPRLMEISKRYGIEFVTPQAPTSAPM